MTNPDMGGDPSAAAGNVVPPVPTEAPGAPLTDSVAVEPVVEQSTVTDEASIPYRSALSPAQQGDSIARNSGFLGSGSPLR